MKHLRGAFLLSTDWNAMASALAYPDFIKRWQAGAWPHFPVVGIDL
jgi:hypothetical protein